MNHQPFREWLLTDEPLSTEQYQALQAHLRTCDSCSQLDHAWNELELVIHKSPQVDPASGFTDRWQTRLAEYQTLQKKHRGWLTIGLTTFIATSLTALLVSQVWSLIQAPGPYLAVWCERLVSIISIYFILQNLIYSSSWHTPLYTFLGLFFLVGMISFMSVLWAAAYRKFSLSRRLA